MLKTMYLPEDAKAAVWAHLARHPLCVPLLSCTVGRAAQGNLEPEETPGPLTSPRSLHLFSVLAKMGK